MIADLKPYPEYRDSEVPWLGEVPVHWQHHRLKKTALLIMGQSPPSESCSLRKMGLPFLQGCAEFGHVNPMPKLYCQAPPKCCPSGAILLSVRAPVGRLNVADQAYGIGRGLCAIVPNDLLFRTAFARYALEVGTQGLLLSSTGSTYDEVSISDIGIQSSIIPPLDEQVAIVRFLDWANGRLERSIWAKRKVIALLDEQKQAIIHRAVTRGLDPTVPLKSSDIPWLGDIPKHWEVRRAKYLFHEVDERSIDGSEELLSVSHITGVTPRSQKNITMFKAKSYVGHKLCRHGDLVVNTMWAWAGALGVSAYSGIVSPSYAVYRPHRLECYNGNYIDGLLRIRPYASNIICHSTGLRPSRLRLYPEEFLRLPIIQPPIEEQRRIVESIGSDNAGLQSTISHLEREIELLREYRTRLVTDVVVGKLDVRKAAERVSVETARFPGMNATLISDELADDSEPNDEEAKG